MGLVKLVDSVQKYPIKTTIELIDDFTIEYSLLIRNGPIAIKKRHAPKHCGIRMMDKLFTEMPPSIGKLGMLLYFEPQPWGLRCAGAFSLTGKKCDEGLLSGQKIILFFPSKFDSMMWYDSETHKEFSINPHHFTFQGKKGNINYHITSEKDHTPIIGSLINTDLGVQLGHLFIKDYQQLDVAGKIYSRYKHEKKICSQFERLNQTVKKSLASKQQIMRVPECYIYEKGGILLSFHLSNKIIDFENKRRGFNKLVLRNGIELCNPHRFKNYTYNLGDDQYLNISVTRFKGDMDTNFMWYSEG
jgi:hypothetical protein